MKKIFASLLAVAALVACNKSELTVTEPQADDVIRFSSNLQTYTVKSTAIDDQNVKIVAGAPINKTVLALANGDGTLTPAEELHWAKDQTAKTTFVSVFPSSLELSATNTIENYDLVNKGEQDFGFHSTVLSAVAKDVTPNTTVNFNYKHPFSMLVVTVDNQLEGTPAVTNVNVANVALQGTLDLVAETVTPSENLGNVNATLQDDKYAVVIMPQSASPVLYVSVGEKNYKFILNTAVDFKANKRYNATVTIKDNTPVVEEGEAVNFGFTVADWEDAADVISYVDITEQWSVIGNIQDTNWNKDFVMAEGETPGVLEVSITYLAGQEFKLRKAEGWDLSAGLKAGVTTVGDDAWDGHLDATDNNIKLAASGVYTLTFNPVDWAFTATKTADVDEPEAETVKLIANVYNGAGWENVKVYVWIGETPICGIWPGMDPVATDVVVNNVTYKSFVIAEYPKNVAAGYILNNGAGIQTADLDIPALTEDTTVYLHLKADNSVEEIDDPATFDPSQEPAVETATLTLNVYNGAGWANVMCYCWNDVDPWPNYTGAWHGMAPAATDVVVNEVSYKSFVIAGLPLNVDTVKYILNDGDTAQTANLDLSALTEDTTMYVHLKADKSVEVIADPATFNPAQE